MDERWLEDFSPEVVQEFLSLVATLLASCLLSPEQSGMQKVQTPDALLRKFDQLLQVSRIRKPGLEDDVSSLANAFRATLRVTLLLDLDSENPQ